MISANNHRIASPEAPTEPTITIIPVTTATELYHHERDYPRPQPVRLWLDIATCQLGASFVPRGDEGSIPKSVFCHRGVIWTIPCLTMDAANRMMTEATPLCRRIIDDTTIEWDGSNNTGTHGPDAQDAIDGVNALISTYDDVDWTIHEYGADECYDDGPQAIRKALGIDADTTDDDLDRITLEETENALSNNTIIPDLREYLVKLREDLRDTSRDELVDVAAKLTELTKRRNELIRSQLTWGDTSRAIGARAELSHAWVQTIGKR